MQQTLVVNEQSLRDMARSRETLFGSLDAKRPRAWETFGYKAALTFDDYLTAYERSGAANGAVHRILDKCWQENPRIKKPEDDEETPFEVAICKAIEDIGGWQRLRDFDRRNMVGRFAGLIYRVADNLPLREPLGTGKLVELVPVYESQLRVQAWDSAQESPTFGKPTMWQYRMRPPASEDRQGQPEQWVDVHPSRLQILAEGSAGDFFDGVPLLKAGFNHLVDLEKVGGGSAESFLKNSARAVTINFDANASPQAITANPDGTASGKSVREVVQGQVDNLNRNIDSAMVTQGAQAGVLQTTVADPEPSFRVAANLFAASVRIPMTILFGAQTGRLASDQDTKDMNARCKSRRCNELTPMLREFVRRMQACGAFEQGEFEIEWEDLDAATDTDKVDMLDKMTNAMEKAFRAGLAEPLFDANELRGVVDYEERANDGLPDPALTPMDDPQLQPGATQPPTPPAD